MTASLLIRKVTLLIWTLPAVEANDFEKVRIEYSLILLPKNEFPIIIVFVHSTDEFNHRWRTYSCWLSHESSSPYATKRENEEWYA